MQLLEAAFAGNAEARPAVLRLCQQALGGGGGGGGGGVAGGGGLDQALPAVLLLGNLVARQTALVHEHAQRVKVRGSTADWAAKKHTCPMMRYQL